MIYLRRSALPWIILAILLWTMVIVKFAATSVDYYSPDFAPRPRGVQILRTVSGNNNNNHKEDELDNQNLAKTSSPTIDSLLVNPITKEKKRTIENPAAKKIAFERVDGFENPNGLPKLPRLGPKSFFEILAPPYYGKSPVDGSRNYEPDSIAREEANCPEAAMSKSFLTVDSLPSQVHSHVEQMGVQRVKAVSVSQAFCSYGPEQYEHSRIASDVYAAYEFHEVCATLNIDSSKRVQRGLVYFDPLNSHPLRCVPCPNPIEKQTWGDHACGLMWIHQINARSIEDFQSCYRQNLKFIAEIDQRQQHVQEYTGGLFYEETVLLVSFARKNPGHQMFDSLFTMMPLLVRNEKPYSWVIVHQDPLCPENEWFCAIMRRLGAIQDYQLLPVFNSHISCFKNIIIPKWGISRSVAYPDAMVQEFRRKLQRGFNLEKTNGLEENPKTKRKLLLYAHDTKSVEVNQHRRIWLDMRKSVAQNESVQDEFAIQIVDDFAQLSTDDQAKAFFEADVVVMPHGGQFGNAMFARAGTIFLEIVCNGYSHLGLTNGGDGLHGYLPTALEFVHVVVIPCACAKGGDVDSDFRFGPQSMLRLIQLASSLPFGTHYAHKLGENKGTKCFGNDD